MVFFWGRLLYIWHEPHNVFFFFFIGTEDLIWLQLSVRFKCKLWPSRQPLLPSALTTVISHDPKTFGAWQYYRANLGWIVKHISYLKQNIIPQQSPWVTRTTIKCGRTLVSACVGLAKSFLLLGKSTKKGRSFVSSIVLSLDLWWPLIEMRWKTLQCSAQGGRKFHLGVH